MRRFIFVWFLVLCFCGTVLGCAAVSRSIEDYKACAGDSDCLSDMTKVKNETYVVTKSATSSIPLPTIPEVISVVVSNIAAFGFGVLKGRKIKKG